MARLTDANEITRQYLDSLLFEQRLLDSELPSAKTVILGKEFATPIMNAAFSHLERRQAGVTAAMAKGIAAAGACNMWGMSHDAEMEAIYAAAPDTIEIIKPYADRDLVFHRIEFARAHGAFAVGMDIDHIYGRDGAYDVVIDAPMGPVSTSQLRSFVKAAGDLPFVVKGVLSVSDAEKCAEAGASAILVSHHHGIFPSAVPPLMILPDIREAVGDALEIYADCGMESGADVLRALALGADAVSVSRHILPILFEKGADGVREEIERMTGELVSLMARTGCTSTADVDPDILWQNS